MVVKQTGMLKGVITKKDLLHTIDDFAAAGERNIFGLVDDHIDDTDSLGDDGGLLSSRTSFLVE